MGAGGSFRQPGPNPSFTAPQGSHPLAAMGSGGPGHGSSSTGSQGSHYLMHRSPGTSRNLTWEAERLCSVFWPCMGDPSICNAPCTGGSWKRSPALTSGPLKHPLFSPGLFLVTHGCNSPSSPLLEALGNLGAGKQVPEHSHSSLGRDTARSEEWKGLCWGPGLRSTEEDLVLQLLMRLGVARVPQSCSGGRKIGEQCRALGTSGTLQAPQVA